MRAILTAAILSVALIKASAASAQTWRPTIEAHCVDQIGEQRGHWPEWARCVIRRAYPHVNPVRVEGCIAQVKATREREQACNLCGDPVKDTVTCATGEAP